MSTDNEIPVVGEVAGLTSINIQGEIPVPDKATLIINGGLPDFKKLQGPFPQDLIEWRIQRAGIKNGGGYWALCIPYCTSRMIQTRLDTIVGPADWKVDFSEWQGKAVKCSLGIRIAGEWIFKHDGAENTNIEAIKGGFTQAMRRAAVQWGIGRYLYYCDEYWANVHEKGKKNGQYKKDKTSKGEHFKWDAPSLPDWALPGGSGCPVDTEPFTPVIGDKPDVDREAPVTEGRIADIGF